MRISSHYLTLPLTLTLSLSLSLSLLILSLYAYHQTASSIANEPLVASFQPLDPGVCAQLRLPNGGLPAKAPLEELPIAICKEIELRAYESKLKSLVSSAQSSGL